MTGLGDLRPVGTSRWEGPDWSDAAIRHSLTGGAGPVRSLDSPDLLLEAR